MTILKITSIALTALILSSCGTSKKSSAPAANIIPGDAELKAIQVKYADVTMQTLNEGYAIYTGACTNCHGKKNIFKRSEASWLHEIDDMSPKAKLTVAQKDALTKYILAMKATAPVTAQ
jgi:mono/diheme cytochrome c family protein